MFCVKNNICDKTTHIIGTDYKTGEPKLIQYLVPTYLPNYKSCNFQLIKSKKNESDTENL